MMKCEGCPAFDLDREPTGGCCFPGHWIRYRHVKDCHLTPAKQTLIRNLLEREHDEDTVRIMEAASRGVLDCGHCEFTDEYGDVEEMRHGIYCIEHDERKTRYAWPCEKWQERRKQVGRQ